MGNRRSVEKALERVGTEVVVSAGSEQIMAADGLVVPGVGAFPEAMRRLTEGGLDRSIRNFAETGRPLLGICLGMQLLFESSSEFESTTGLGLLSGTVERLDTDERLPHIGWNLVTFSRPDQLTEGLGEAAAFYHVHSYAVRPASSDDVLGEGEYGRRFASIVRRDNVIGVQFHPEKSSRDGLKLLENFAALTSTA